MSDHPTVLLNASDVSASESEGHGSTWTVSEEEEDSQQQQEPGPQDPSAALQTHSCSSHKAHAGNDSHHVPSSSASTDPHSGGVESTTVSTCVIDSGTETQQTMVEEKPPPASSSSKLLQSPAPELISSLEIEKSNGSTMGESGDHGLSSSPPVDQTVGASGGPGPARQERAEYLKKRPPTTEMINTENDTDNECTDIDSPARVESAMGFSSAAWAAASKDHQDSGEGHQAGSRRKETLRDKVIHNSNRSIEDEGDGESARKSWGSMDETERDTRTEPENFSSAATQPQVPPSTVLIEGWIEKTGGGKSLISTRKRRWFQLTPEKLIYYKDASKKLAKGEVYLDDVECMEEVNDGWFIMYTPGIHGGEYRVRVYGRKNQEQFKNHITDLFTS
eukprot:gb/GECG01004289.1/.p1 GENE.gb/GECG01004289.1/~~gb/GECG01004289.1/.p1  ORF type:complete len:392 (+),score=63.54 gb/GECG01004289.1/:1-1176(+)